VKYSISTPALIASAGCNAQQWPFRRVVSDGALWPLDPFLTDALAAKLLAVNAVISQERDRRSVPVAGHAARANVILRQCSSKFYYLGFGAASLAVLADVSKAVKTAN
jgi:hypothetical protein